MQEQWNHVSFEYDQKFPPLCFNPHDENTLMDFDMSMQGILQDMVKDSIDTGMKDVQAVLKNGLTIGEAALIIVKENKIEQNFLYQNPRRKDVLYSDEKLFLDLIEKQLIEKMEVESNNINHILFQKHMNKEFFHSKHPKKQFMYNVKNFLSEIGLKTKGYTAKLNQVVAIFEKEFSNRKSLFPNSLK